MKQDIHPDYGEATITCNGCGNTFTTRATTDHIEVEICAECHPFYTGKQKLVDVAGRVDRFRAHQQAAQEKGDSKKKQNRKTSVQSEDVDNETAEADQSSADKKHLSDLKDLKDNT